jgi:starch synthase
VGTRASTVKILYVALKETLPGSHGGAVHVLEVARQLTRRGHEVTVLVRQKAEQAPRESMDGFEVLRLPARSNFLLFQLETRVREILTQRKPDLVMERYYNFSGAGVRAAQRAHLPSLLEVNAPMMDPPGSRKYLADRLMFGWMTRLAREQAHAAKRIITPLAATVPFAEARDRVREIPWGANVEMFDPMRLNTQEVEALRAQINPHQKRVVAFLGSFRPWHGVREFVQMAQKVARERDDVLFLMIGSGELLDVLRIEIERAGLQDKIILTGAVNYDRVPYYLALVDVGVAPFNTAVHAPLRFGFYWSPLKVHEYMAMGLPVVTIDVAGLNQIARHEREGLLYREGDVQGLRDAILRLVDDPSLARRLGQAGRTRVVENFSWQRHAELLEKVLMECVG